MCVFNKCPSTKHSMSSLVGHDPCQTVNIIDHLLVYRTLDSIRLGFITEGFTKYLLYFRLPILPIFGLILLISFLFIQEGCCLIFGCPLSSKNNDIGREYLLHPDIQSVSYRFWTGEWIETEEWYRTWRHQD